MAGLEVADQLWERIRPLLPVVARRHRWPGRKRLEDRACLNGILFVLSTGILFVLSTGIRWDRLPQQLGYGSGMTCWRRLRDWQAAGACGTGYMYCCWPNCALPIGSTGHGPWWIPRTCGP